MDLKIFTKNIEEQAINQINELLKQETFKNSKVRIMPDVHAGKGCVIGFTGNLGEKVIPNIVGVDIGCGMLWEVERILNELKTTNSLPQILLMENVPQVHGSDNVEHFNKWQLALEKLGYKNYFQDLIATDYGIPQTRNRCFMVSILGEYSYTFPKPIPLELKLKDLLEKEVDEKYYLSDKQIKCLSSNKVYKNGYIRGNQFKKNINPDVCTTITASSSDRASDTFISIKNATKKGYLEATDGDGINLSNRMEHQRGNVQKDKIQTLTTSGGNDRGVCVGTYQYAKSDKFMNGKDRLQLGKEVSDTLQTAPKEGVCYNDLRIRKLSPLECWRLMGVKDEDYYKIVKNQSNSSLYHLAGDSIVVNVLMAIFKELIK